VSWTSRLNCRILWVVFSSLGVLLVACGLRQPIPPVAEAGAPLTVPAGQPLTLDGSGSFDPAGGRIVSYTWSVAGAPVGRGADLRRILGGPGPNPTLTIVLASGTGAVGVWTIELDVADDEGLHATDVVTVTVEP